MHDILLNIISSMWLNPTFKIIICRPSLAAGIGVGMGYSWPSSNASSCRKSTSKYNKFTALIIHTQLTLTIKMLSSICLKPINFFIQMQQAISKVKKIHIGRSPYSFIFKSQHCCTKICKRSIVVVFFTKKQKTIVARYVSLVRAAIGKAHKSGISPQRQHPIQARCQLEK